MVMKGDILCQRLRDIWLINAIAGREHLGWVSLIVQEVDKVQGALGISILDILPYGNKCRWNSRGDADSVLDIKALTETSSDQDMVATSQSGLTASIPPSLSP